MVRSLGSNWSENSPTFASWSFVSFLKAWKIALLEGYMFWALPMLKAVRGLRSCEIFMEHSDPGIIRSDRLIPLGRLISLDDLAALMCLELSSPEDAPACVQKAILDYPTTCKGPPSYPFRIVSRHDPEWAQRNELRAILC